MLTLIDVFIPGNPQGKARAKSTFQNGKMRHYTPKKTVEYERGISLQCQAAMNRKALRASSGPIDIKIKILMPVPKSWPAWKSELALLGQIYPTVKPDDDNVEKAVKDALNKVAWLDDCQVVDCVKSKRYSRTPGVHVIVKQIPGYPANIKSKKELAA